MKNSEREIALPMLLFLYLTGRVLQPFAGRVPNLLIVALHVIPPALFAGMHGARVYGWRGMLAFTGICLGVGSFFESMSLRTGFPFGHYRFTDLMGPKIFGLPILLALTYVGMGYLAWVVSLAIIGNRDEPLAGRRLFLLPLLASVVMTVWDLAMEAVWADIDRAWIWRDGGWYFGVPISNFLGWFLTVYVFYQLFAWYLRGRATLPVRSRDWSLAIWFYALSAVGNLLVTAPSSAAGIFLDATGRRWMISHILWTSRLMSIGLMLPFSVIAWFKVSKVPGKVAGSTG